MTRDEANKIHELFNNLTSVTIISDWVAGTMEIATFGINGMIIRNFNIDPPIQQPTGVTMGFYGNLTAPSVAAPVTNNPKTYNFKGPGIVNFDEFKGLPVLNPLKCTCGADKCGGSHSNWCDKHTV